MRTIILLILFASIYFECIGQCGKDTVFITKKFCKEKDEYTYENNIYYPPKYVEVIKHDTIPLNNVYSQIIYGNCIIRGTQGEIRTSEVYLNLDSVKVEKINFYDNIYQYVDSIFYVNENNSCYTITVIVDSNIENELFLFDINHDRNTDYIELWAYPYSKSGEINFNIVYYKLTYFLTKSTNKKFKFKFRRLINYDYD